MFFRKKIKIKCKGCVIPEKINVGDWIDLSASEEVIIHPGQFKKIPLGVAMQLPRRYEAHILPRSSTFGKYGIVMTNSMGIIDNSYRGDFDFWSFPAYNLSCDTAHIMPGDRICQFRIVRNQPKIRFIRYEFFDTVSRGGFGSTGVR